MDELQAALLDWYAAGHRDLPWRRTTDPYAILVSEVMLQQTQVARVVPRFEAWLERWPTVAALAAATRAEVLGAWVGLGYNTRALRLHAACVVIAREGWPRTAAGLRGLPGVGPYTAAAVASFAFGERVAAVDTNVRRVAARIGAVPGELLPAERHADWNQAAMELGATFCTARSPNCEPCPAGPWCASRGQAIAARGGRAPRERFEESDRWARGRVVASLAAGEGLPEGIADERLARVLAALERDGLVERHGSYVRLPGSPR